MPPTKPIADFWKKMEWMPNGCLEWRGSVNGNGYGSVSIRALGKKPRGAHVAAWELCGGDVPDGMWVLHKCDNRRCCNVTHLFLGTPSDNIQDCIAKGRARRTPSKGERNGSSKLTESDIREIRSVYASQSGVTQTALAKRFGVVQSVISAIILKQRWKHVSD